METVAITDEQRRFVTDRRQQWQTAGNKWHFPAITSKTFGDSNSTISQDFKIEQVTDGLNLRANTSRPFALCIAIPPERLRMYATPPECGESWSLGTTIYRIYRCEIRIEYIDQSSLLPNYNPVGAGRARSIYIDYQAYIYSNVTGKYSSAWTHASTKP